MKEQSEPKPDGMTRSDRRKDKEGQVEPKPTEPNTPPPPLRRQIKDAQQFKGKIVDIAAVRRWLIQ